MFHQGSQKLGRCSRKKHKKACKNYCSQASREGMYPEVNAGSVQFGQGHTHLLRRLIKLWCGKQRSCKNTNKTNWHDEKNIYIYYYIITGDIDNIKQQRCPLQRKEVLHLYRWFTHAHTVFACVCRAWTFLASLSIWGQFVCIFLFFGGS